MTERSLKICAECKIDPSNHSCRKCDAIVCDSPMCCALKQGMERTWWCGSCFHNRSAQIQKESEVTNISLITMPSKTALLDSILALFSSITLQMKQLISMLSINLQCQQLVSYVYFQLEKAISLFLPSNCMLLQKNEWWMSSKFLKTKIANDLHWTYCCWDVCGTCCSSLVVVLVVLTIFFLFCRMTSMLNIIRIPVTGISRCDNAVLVPAVIIAFSELIIIHRLVSSISFLSGGSATLSQSCHPCSIADGAHQSQEANWVRRSR